MWKTSVYEIVTLATGGTVKMVGLYRDFFVGRVDKWYFSRREYGHAQSGVTPTE